MPSERKNGVRILDVEPASAAHEAGLRPGDVLLSIDGYPVGDSLDYMFCRDEPELEVVVKHRGRERAVHIEAEEGEDLGLVLEDFKVKSCGNKCIFCFVSQLPKGLRRPLYLKDEDYRMSFLYGNYVTLTNLSAADKRRIVEQRLSPLYISVHATDPELRRLMLGNPKAPDVMKELTYYARHRIHMHTQIVLCPGYNDGAQLRRTLRDLCSLYPYIGSVAVVPVGLTAHRRQQLTPVETDDALAAIREIENFQQKMKKRHGDPVVYAADELYIKAGLQFPPLKEYGELPQIENGVGMVRLFKEMARRLRPKPPKGATPRYLTFTGTSFFPFLTPFIERLRKHGYDVSAHEVENHFFGTSVSVAGLLTGRDVMRSLAGRTKEYDMLLIPDIVLRDSNDMFLDDVRPADIARALKIKVDVIESTPHGLYERIAA